jgi:hypothetical protein
VGRTNSVVWRLTTATLRFINWERDNQASASPGSGQHWVALRSKKLHDEPAISYATDRCSALAFVNSDGCGVLGTYWGRIVSGCGGLI